MRALHITGALIIGFMMGVGCTPLMEVSTPAANVTVTLPEQGPKAPTNPKVVCQYMVRSIAGGVAMLDGLPKLASVEQLQAGGVITEYKEERTMKCRRVGVKGPEPERDKDTPKPVEGTLIVNRR